MFRINNVPWNKGLKAEDDIRIKINSIKSSKTFKDRGYKTRLGIPHSEETKIQIGNSRKEYCKTHSGYWKDKNHSKSTKRKISDKKKGTKLTLEHRIKISQGLEKAGRTNLEKDYGFTRMNYQIWRKSILGRDNHICQLCFSDYKIIVAHHILPFKTHRLLRYEISNGITLCKECHLALHSFSSLTKKAEITVKLQLLSKLLKALDNTVPNLGSNTFGGVTTNGESIVDNNSDTSPAPEKKGRDSLSQVAISGSSV